MKTLFLLALLAPAAALAEKPDGQTAHVLQMDSDFPIDELEGKGIDLHPLSEMQENEEALPLALQNQFFLDSGLTPLLVGWSGFDKDRLALRAENQTAAQVAARYEGKIPEASIQKFKDLARKYRASRSRR